MGFFLERCCCLLFVGGDGGETRRKVVKSRLDGLKLRLDGLNQKWGPIHFPTENT